MHNVGRAVLTFSCKPYLYRKDGVLATKYTQSGFVLTNPEQYRSVPDITVYGTGNIYLNIGYNQYYMEDIRSQIILDGVRTRRAGGHARFGRRHNAHAQHREFPQSQSRGHQRTGR